MCKKLFIFLLMPCLLTSCYAFLKADKLVYSGTMAKRPVSLSVDTLYQTEVKVNSVDN